MRLAIIIVSWNTRDLLRRCIQTVHASLAASDIAYCILVVDNASSDGTPAMLRAECPEVELIDSGANLGFAGGNNLALRRILSSEDSANSTLSPQHSNLDYVLLLNPDTEVVGDAIVQLVRYLDAHPDVVVVGPQLRYPDGSVQSSRRRFPTRGVYFLESTPLANHWPNNPWARRYHFADKADDTEQEVDWLVGAALLVRRNAIEHAGLLDAEFAMYSEELEWQQRIKGLGSGVWGLGAKSSARPAVGDERMNLNTPGRIIYLPSAVIIHHEGQSSDQAPARRYINFQRSRIREANMRYGARFAALLRLFLRASYTAELGIEATKWLLGHKRVLRAERLRVYREVLREL